MADVTITLPEQVARSVMQAIYNSTDRWLWGHHQWDRGIALRAFEQELDWWPGREAASSKGASDG